MADETLLKYIHDELRIGTPRSVISKKLQRVGWDREAVDRALEVALTQREDENLESAVLVDRTQELSPEYDATESEIERSVLMDRSQEISKAEEELEETITSIGVLDESDWARSKTETPPQDSSVAKTPVSEPESPDSSSVVPPLLDPSVIEVPLAAELPEMERPSVEEDWPDSPERPKMSLDSHPRESVEKSAHQGPPLNPPPIEAQAPPTSSPKKLTRRRSPPKKMRIDATTMGVFCVGVGILSFHWFWLKLHPAVVGPPFLVVVISSVLGGYRKWGLLIGFLAAYFLAFRFLPQAKVPPDYLAFQASLVWSLGLFGVVLGWLVPKAMALRRS